MQLMTPLEYRAKVAARSQTWSQTTPQVNAPRMSMGRGASMQRSQELYQVSHGAGRCAAEAGEALARGRKMTADESVTARVSACSSAFEDSKNGEEGASAPAAAAAAAAAAGDSSLQEIADLLLAPPRPRAPTRARPAGKGEDTEVRSGPDKKGGGSLSAT